MEGFQRLEVMGTLGGDPQPRQINDSMKVASFPIAINETRKNQKTGEKVTNTTWITAEVWNQTADFVCNFLKKGSNVFAEGKIRIDNVKDEAGNYKTYVKFVVDNIKILPSAGGPQGSGGGQNGAGYQQQPQGQQYVGVGPQNQPPAHQNYQQNAPVQPVHNAPAAVNNGYQGAPQQNRQGGYQSQPQNTQGQHPQGNVESNVNNYMGGAPQYDFSQNDDLPF